MFGTYSQPFEKLTVQLGLRLEDTQVDLTQVSLGLDDHHDYVRAYPAVHLTYKLDDARQLSASYSERVTRPPPSLMDPFRALITFSDFQQGNPDLKPETTDAFESSYHERRGQTSYIATAYYRRRTGDEVGPIQTSLGDGPCS